MRKLIPALALTLAAAGAPNVASAHGPDIRIAGLQFVYTTFFENGGIPGYISVPLAPPVHIGGAASTNGGASTSYDDQIGILQNHDRVPHSFTECTSLCDTAEGSSAGARFDVALPPGAVVGFLDAADPLEPGHYIFMCTVHPYMRGELTVRA